MFSIHALFNQSKRKSVPIARIPKKVKDMLNVSSVYENGVFQLEEKGNRKLFDCAYAFEDVNYINQDAGEKEQFLLKLCSFLNAMDSEFKISICKEYQDMDALVEELFTTTHKERYPEIEKGMSQWVEEKIKEGTPNVKKILYLVVTTRTKDFKDANIYFNLLESQLQQFFQSWKSRLIRLDVHARLCTLQGFLRADHDYIKGDVSQFKNDILPTAVRQYKNYLELGDSCVSILYGFQYQNTIKADEFLYRLSSMDYPAIVTLDIAPIASNLLQDKVDASMAANEFSISREQDEKNSRGLHATGISYRKNKTKTELENLSDQIDRNDENGFFVGLLIMVTAKDEFQLRDRLDHVIAIGKEQKVKLDIYNYQQLKALNTVLPFGGRQVDHMRTMLTSSLCGLQPYHAVDVVEAGGHIYGSNRTTKLPIVGDRKKLKNPHGLISGHSGSGKSMFIKETEISQTLLRTDDDIIIIDPQNEFASIVESFGGAYLDFTPKSKIQLNSLEIPEHIYYDDNQMQKDYFISKQTEYLVAFCRSTMKEVQVNQLYDLVVGRCTRRLYKEAFERKQLKQPTLKHFRKEIENEIKNYTDQEDIRIAKEIHGCLEEYTVGAYDMFAKPSNVSFNNRLIGFGIRQVSEKNWESVMITIMNFLSNRMEFNKANQRATRLIVDETQVVCESDFSAQMLLNAVVTFRKFGGICTFAIQNMAKALEHPKLRDMFSNCEFKVFFDQAGIDAKVLAEIQELSDTELQALQDDRLGSGIMVWGKKVLLLDSYMEKSNALYDLFSTNYHEKAEEDIKEKIEVTHEVIEKGVPNFGTQE